MPKFIYEIDLKNGCGDSLNKDALELQNKALEIIFEPGETIKAIKILEKAIDMEPRLIPAYINLSTFYCLGMHDCDKSIFLMKRAIELCATEPRFYEALANAYSQKREHKEAINNLLKAKEIAIALGDKYYKNSASLFFNLGNSYAMLKDFAEAIKNYEEAIRLKNDYFNAWHNLIRANFDIGNRTRAIELAKELAQKDQNGKYGLWAQEFLRRVE